MHVIHSSRSSGVPLDELLEQSDYVSLHTPLTPETRHLMGAEQFKRMKKTAYLINTARGGVVDQVALREALEAGEIAGAGLDVTEPEPLPKDDPLLTAPNLLVVPHVGSATFRTRSRMADMAVDNLLAALAGKDDAPPRRREPRRRGRHRQQLHPPADRVGRRASSPASRSSPVWARASTRPAGSATPVSSACSTSCTCTAPRSRPRVRAGGGGHDLGGPRRRQRPGVRRARPRGARLRAPHAQRRRGGAADLRRRDAWPRRASFSSSTSAAARPSSSRRPTAHVSTQIGVVRHTERHLRSDPPTARELAKLTDDVHETLMAHVPVRMHDNPVEAIAVAGTPTQCAAIELGLDHVRPGPHRRPHPDCAGAARSARPDWPRCRWPSAKKSLASTPRGHP